MDPRGARHLVLVRPSTHLVPAKQPDDAVERAIALLARELATPWTVTMLGRRVALSRPALARRFTAHTGHSPMRYLAMLRMDRAAELLSERDDTLASIAAEVGYVSEFAFNRAFKRHHGVAPGAFRRLQRAQPMAFRAAA